MSIVSRLRVYSLLLVAILAVTTTGLLVEIFHTQHVADARRHARETILAAQTAFSALQDAETGQRGYLLTGADRYLVPYTTAMATLSDRIEALNQLVEGDPDVAPLVAIFDGAAKEKMLELSETIQLRRTQGFEPALQVVLTDRGKEAMDRARATVEQLITLRRAQIRVLDNEVQTINFWLVVFVAGEGLSLAGAILLMNRLFVQNFRRSLDALNDGIARVTDGNFVTDIEISGRDELGRLGRSFNVMVGELRQAVAGRLASEEALGRTNAALLSHSAELEKRTRTIDLLGRLANRLPGCAGEAEFAEVMQRFIPQLLPGIGGVLYTLTNSQVLLQSLCSWNGPLGAAVDFLPRDCWSLRRGQPHIVMDMRHDVACKHVQGNEALSGYRCFPLVAQGETVGVLYLEEWGAKISVEDADLEVLMETVASALAGLRLRERLRTQSIRDPLTGLFNRRYLEESLELECARADRAGTPLAAIMADVDHFKRFNDTFGHDAGDVVLKHLGQTMRETARQGDVACRYGGEEFVVLLPGTSIKDAAALAERMRLALSRLELSHGKQSLGRVTASFGVAAYPADASTSQTLIAAADAALYAAKGAGRDRVIHADENHPSSLSSEPLLAEPLLAEPLLAEPLLAEPMEGAA